MISVKSLFQQLNLPTEGVTFGITVDHGISFVEVKGPFTALQLVDLYALLDKTYNRDPMNRKYNFTLVTTLTK